MFAPAITDPVERVAALEEMLRETVAMLRIALDEFDLPDAPDDLHPADVVEKYLVRPLYWRLSDLGWEPEDRDPRGG